MACLRNKSSEKARQIPDLEAGLKVPINPRWEGLSSG